MKLSLQIISAKLDADILMPLAEDADARLRLSRPVFYTGETLLKSDTLYIAKGASLAETIEFEPGCGLICIGFPERTTSSKRLADLLVLDGKTDILRISNRINAIFDYYDGWEARLAQASSGLAPDALLPGLAELSAPVIGAALSANASAGVITFENPDDADPVKEALLAELNRFAAGRITNSSEMSSPDYPDLARLLALCIDRGPVSRQMLTAELKKVGCSPEDRFVLFYFKPDAQEAFLANAGSFCSEFMSAFSPSFAFIYRQSVIAFIKLIGAEPESLYKDIKKLAGSHGFKGGASNAFNNVFALNTYYKEARYAYNLGEAAGSEERLCRFCDYSFDYITGRACEELPAFELYSPIYYRLKEYDDANGTDYLITLRAYLASGMNAQQAAKDMYIHRATINYRLKRICEIGQTELTDSKELLHLYLTFNMAGPSEKDTDE